MWDDCIAVAEAKVITDRLNLYFAFYLREIWFLLSVAVVNSSVVQ